MLRCSLNLFTFIVAVVYTESKIIKNSYFINDIRLYLAAFGGRFKSTHLHIVIQFMVSFDLPKLHSIDDDNSYR